ncbi:MAG: hypothetical protein V1781_05320 [Bacteroidota bacterium]
MTEDNGIQYLTALAITFNWYNRLVRQAHYNLNCFLLGLKPMLSFCFFLGLKPVLSFCFFSAINGGVNLFTDFVDEPQIQKFLSHIDLVIDLAEIAETSAKI